MLDVDRLVAGPNICRYNAFSIWFPPWCTGIEYNKLLFIPVLSPLLSEAQYPEVSLCWSISHFPGFYSFTTSIHFKQSSLLYTAVLIYTLNITKLSVLFLAYYFWFLLYLVFLSTYLLFIVNAYSCCRSKRDYYFHSVLVITCLLCSVLTSHTKQHGSSYPSIIQSDFHVGR